MTTRTKALLAVLGVCVVAGAAMLWANRPPPPSKMSAFIVPEEVKNGTARTGPPPVMFEAPKFQMTDQNGQPAGDKALHGKVWIADFIFTHCAGACPKVTAKFVELQKEINDPEIRFVSFSVDPARDDPATLKEYGDKNNAGDMRWMLLRPADQKEILHVAQRMAAVAPSANAHDSILHTDFFILIDPDGKVRGLYDSKSDKDVQRLKTDAAMLIAQRSVGRDSKRAAT
jgi:cytochrome oxidase Cu insertion factor (SCO1/SenC/PrrC family)